MNVVKGTIQKISVKEPKDGKFGKFAGYGVQVNGEWYNGLCNERNGEVWPLDKHDNKMKEGQEVELLLEKNSKGYDNIVTKQTTILGGEQAPEQPNKTPERPNPPMQTTPKGNQEFRAALWVNCLDSAINAARVSGKESVPTEDILRAADIFFVKALQK